jgi:predicted ABC-type transport system involved in lysophospholipase L1 biosynthesis ATPase subunit
MNPAEPEPARVLHAEDLAKSYRSGPREIQVLGGVTLSLNRGETASIRGESGSGKTTLLNLLAGIEVPDTGDVHWDGTPLLSIPEGKRPGMRARYLGFIFQSYYLIPELNALDNVLLAARIAGHPLRQARERAELLLVELGMGDRLQGRPDQLSGGERQRTAIARALMNKPRVVLADEPTGNLDERTAERVMEQLLTAVEGHGAALLLVTHHPGYAARTQQQFHLVEGRLE